jgi:hypothetical protein
MQNIYGQVKFVGEGFSPRMRYKLHSILRDIIKGHWTIGRLLELNTKGQVEFDIPHGWFNYRFRFSYQDENAPVRNATHGVLLDCPPLSVSTT